MVIPNMAHAKGYAPTEDELLKAATAHRLKLITFNPNRERLESADFLPRYNRCRISVQKLVEFSSEVIFITVRRLGSKLANDNFYTEPLFVGDLKVGYQSEYDLLSFDAFAIPFETIEISPCLFSEYQKRQISLTPDNIPRLQKMTIPVLNVKA